MDQRVTMQKVNIPQLANGSVGPTEAFASWGGFTWAAFSSIGGLPGGVVVKWRSRVAEPDGLAFLPFCVGGRGFCVILGDYHRSRYPRAHAPCPLEPPLYYARVLAQRVTRALDPLVARMVARCDSGPNGLFEVLTAQSREDRAETHQRNR